MKFRLLPFWKDTPFFRYIIPFSAGILGEWYFGSGIVFLLSGCASSVILLLLFNILRVAGRFRYFYIAGIAVNGLFLFGGAAIVYLNDIKKDEHWFARFGADTSALIVKIEEPLIEKQRSWKTVVSVLGVVAKNKVKVTRGKMILYISKDSVIQPDPGSKLLISVFVKPVENFENNNGFDFRRYCALRNIYHVGYLKKGRFIQLPDSAPGYLTGIILFFQQRTIAVLRTYIHGSKELGLAEALLIGYREDLDKSLLLSYTNTGVVHIIAISGLHVGLIYSILVLVLRPLSLIPGVKRMMPFLLLVLLWVFCLIAGASPSVVRSGAMFSGIIIGKSISKKSNIYNSLFTSAFLLLCYDPLWIFDVGFQLSYLAVLSLSLFMKPVYDLIFIRNKLLDTVWKLCAVTLSAQVLTIPVCLYYFHQFPNFFLITNIVAVPLSGLILVMEIVLCAFSWFAPLAVAVGALVSWLIGGMNSFIEYTEKLPFAVTRSLQISIFQVLILYLIVAVCANWMLKRGEKAL